MLSCVSLLYLLSRGSCHLNRELEAGTAPWSLMTVARKAMAASAAQSLLQLSMQASHAFRRLQALARLSLHTHSNTKIDISSYGRSGFTIKIRAGISEIRP